jgi:hypothetical protein
MRNHTEGINKERLSERVDKLTEENQRCFLGVLEALSFAQSAQNTIVPGFLEKNSPVDMSIRKEEERQEIS